MNVKLSGLKFSSVATTLPKTKLPISDLYDQFGQREVSRIAMSTGIQSLGVADNGVKASDLCASAARRLFEAGDIAASDIDGIIFVSQTPDYIMPATSCLLQQRLGLRQNVVAFDINYGCSGYIYGLYQAALLVSSGSCQHVLVCCGDTMTQHLDSSDHKVRLVLGDAGSATIISKGDDDWAFNINTDGKGFDKLIIPRDEQGNDGCLWMDGSAIMEFALREVQGSIDQVLIQNGWDKSSLSQAVLHQPNQFMLNYLRKKLKLTKEQVPIAVAQYGNTGPASIPLTLCDHYHGQGVLSGQTVFSGFGVGLSWGSIALNIDNALVLAPNRIEETLCNVAA